MSDFKQEFLKMEIDSLNRQISFIKTHVRNLIVDIEEGLDIADILTALKEITGEQQ